MSDKQLTIICVAYKRYKNIPILIHALLAQSLQNFRLIVLHDGYDEEMHKILDAFKCKHPDVIDYVFSEERYNDWGHTLREIGIRMADTEYLLITNDDNYYCPVFVANMFAALHAHKADIVLCDMIHSHNQPGGRSQPAYALFETAPQRCSIDIGCFIARTELAKKVGFRDKSHDGDATYFEDLINVKPDVRIVKVNQVLFVHN